MLTRSPPALLRTLVVTTAVRSSGNIGAGIRCNATGLRVRHSIVGLTKDGLGTLGNGFKSNYLTLVAKSVVAAAASAAAAAAAGDSTLGLDNGDLFDDAAASGITLEVGSTGAVIGAGGNTSSTWVSGNAGYGIRIEAPGTCAAIRSLVAAVTGGRGVC